MPGRVTVGLVLINCQQNSSVHVAVCVNSTPPKAPPRCVCKRSCSLGMRCPRPLPIPAMRRLQGSSAQLWPMAAGRFGPELVPGRPWVASRSPGLCCRALAPSAAGRTPQPKPFSKCSRQPAVQTAITRVSGSNCKLCLAQPDFVSVYII